MLLMSVEVFHKMPALYRNGLASLDIRMARIPSLASRLESMCARPLTHVIPLMKMSLKPEKKKVSLLPVANINCL